MSSTEPSSPAVVIPLRPQGKSVRGLILTLLLGLLASGLAAVIGLFAYFYFRTPQIEALKNYSPPMVSEVFAADDVKIGEFYRERRLPAQREEIPSLLMKAFVASEDDNFFQHPGIDLRGVVRAMIKNLLAGEVKQGGSTITQQVAKSLLLSSERTFTRKIKEAILAYRIEKYLTKEEILDIYLNQIYLGHGSYGVKAAADNYFGKELSDLNLAEMAILAGLPQAPSRDSPVIHPERAKQRQQYVLQQMEKNGIITREQREEALRTLVRVTGKRNYTEEMAPSFTEQVRRYLVEKYSNETLLNGGLKVFTTLHFRYQQAAQAALREGLRELDKRQGWRGPLNHLEGSKGEEFARQSKELWGTAKPVAEDRYEALVTDVRDEAQAIAVAFGPHLGILPFPLAAWALKPNTPSKKVVPSALLKKGDLLLVRLAAEAELDKASLRKLAKTFPGHYVVALEQEPQVQGALVSLDPRSGEIRAMVGGYDFRTSQFNRAMQARRQPGSAFKPIIFSAALDHGYTAASMIIDSPVVFDDSVKGEKWKPKNYGGKFEGEIIFRDALIQSRNIPTVKIVEDIGVDYLIAYAEKLGYPQTLQRDFSIALGSAVISPLELATIYCIFANGGIKVEPRFIRRVVGRDGSVLESHDPTDFALSPSEEAAFLTSALDKQAQMMKKMAEIKSEVEAEPNLYSEEEKIELANPDRVLSPQTAYLMTNLLKEVVTSGTGYRARALNRPAAGKTGTTDDSADAWFIGYTPDLLAAVWAGFDDNSKSLGNQETGARAASPMWLKFMQQALQEEGIIKDFQTPRRIVFARIDRKTGKLSNRDTPDTVQEAFLEGTLPQEGNGPTKSEERENFFLKN